MPFQRVSRPLLIGISGGAACGKVRKENDDSNLFRRKFVGRLKKF